jgi:hypothetical protein
MAAVTALALVLSAAVGAAPATRLFVRDGARLVERDLSSGRVVREVALPADLQDLAIDRTGRAVGMLAPDATHARAWVWDGTTPRIVTRRLPRLPGDGASHEHQARQAVRVAPDADGTHLFWLVDDMREAHIVRTRGGLDAPRITRRAQVWRTDARARAPLEVAALDFEPCTCESGDCEETCPLAKWDVPPSGVEDVLFVTSWVPGQLGSRFLGTWRVRKDGVGGWVREPLPEAVHEVRDFADPDTWVDITHDGGCCGWVNFGSDMTGLVREDERVVLLDEHARFGNPNYDVSFRSVAVRISPDGRHVAHTLAALSGAAPGEDVRLGARPGARADPRELARVKRAMVGLPAVEVFDMTGAVVRRVARRELVGWRDEHRIVMLNGEDVVMLDVRDGRELSTPLRIARPDPKDRASDLGPGERLWLR